MVELNFVRAEISAVLEFYSKATGKIFVPHPNLEGTLTIIAPFRMSVDEALQVLAAALAVRGFTLVPEGDRIVKIVPIAEARQQALETRFGDAQKPPVPPSQLVTQVFPLRYLNARQMQAELQPLLSAQNALLASTSIGNMLIVVDTQANIDRLSQLIKLMDVDLSAQVAIEVVPLQYADAQQVAQALGQLLAPMGVVVGSAPRPTAPTPGPPSAPAPSLAVTTASIQLVPFPHSNALLVWAPKERMEWVKAFIRRLDTPAAEALQVEIFRLQFADAADMERILSELFERRTVTAPPGQPPFQPPQPQPQPQQTGQRRAVPTEPEAIITSDPRTNSVIVAATRERLDAIRQLIQQLDVDARPNLQFKIIPLQRAYAPDTAQILQTLLVEGVAAAQRQPSAGRFAAFFAQPSPTAQAIAGGAVRSGEIRIAADTRANALVVAATRENLALVEQLVAELDKDYLPPVKVKDFVLKYADATQVADMLNRMVQTTAQPRGGFPFFFAGIPFEQRVAGPSQWMGFQQNVVVADPRRNAVVVATTDANMPLFEQVIAQLDQPADLGRLVKVYPVQNVDAQALADTINSIMQQQRRPTGFLFFALQTLGGTQQLGPLQNLQDVTVTADNRTNSIVVTAPPSAFSAIDSLIEQLDRPQPQVFIEVIIADVTLTKELQFGVEWHISQQNIFGATNQVTTDVVTGTPTPSTTGAQGLFYTYLSDNFRAILQALARDQKVQVIATPHILTMANVQAQIQIGQLFPVVTTFFPGTVGTPPQISTELRSIATTLQVTPRVNNAGFIVMDIVQTIDDLGGTVTQAGFTQPIINNRQARTSVTVRDGETVVIGGIMRDRVQEIKTGIPILKDLPLIGALFRRTEKSRERTELMVFLTPRIIRHPAELPKLTEEERKRSRLAPPLPTPTVPQQQQKQNALPNAQPDRETPLESVPTPRR